MASTRSDEVTLRDTVARVWTQAGLDRIAHCTENRRTITRGDYEAAALLPVSLAKTTARDMFAPTPGEPANASMPEGITVPSADLRVDRLLGEGGMGRVLLARQQSLHRDVAIKTVKPDVANVRMHQSLFEEGVITGALEHPNIIPVHLLGTDAHGRPVLVMKRVEGVAWNALLEDAAHPAWQRLPGSGDDRLAANLGVLMATCNALHFAHRRGVVHRDVKPENVMLGEFGEVYLVDWGIALVMPSAVGDLPQRELGLVGTPGFMAPEMVAEVADRVDARTDVYLLGATLHLVLTGTLRHHSASLMETLFVAAQSKPVAYPSSVPDELGRICNRATSADPNARYQTAIEFRDALAEFLRHRGAVALSDVSYARLDDLRATSNAPTPDPHRPQRTRQLLTECRFGFMQSLAQWPENERARAGLRDCLLFSLEEEIRKGSLDAVESLLKEIEDPPASLVRAAQGLRDEAEARRAREARYRDMETQLDFRLAALPRVLLFTALFAIGVLGWQWVEGWSWKTSLTTPPSVLARPTAIGLVVFITVAALGRKRFLKNRVNAHLVIGVVIGIAGMLLNRTCAMIPAPLVVQTLSADLVVCASLAALGGLVFARWLWFQVPCFALGAVVTRLIPNYSSLVFVIAAGTAFLTGLITWRRFPATDLLRNRDETDGKK